MIQNPIFAPAQAELERAQAAREKGLEGRARVCARRAAGGAIRAYLIAQNLPCAGTTAMDALGDYSTQAELAPRMRLALQRLLQRVDQDYQMPAEIDLIKEAQYILEELDGK